MLTFFKTYSVNFLSLLNIIFSFIFTLLFALFYKVSSVADAYFYALIIYSNVFLIIQLFYSTFFNIYLHTKAEKQRNNLYYMLLFVLLLVSILVIGSYFLLTSSFQILSDSVKDYLDIYIFTLLFAPLISITIQLMNAKKEFYYAYYYPIGRNIIALVLLWSYQSQLSLSFLAYGFLLYDLFFFGFILLKAIKLLGFQMVYFDKSMFLKIIHKSFMDKTGQFFLGLPELLISNILVNQFSGILSIYSYIKKFVTALIQFIFMPQHTIYTSKIALYLHKYKNYGIRLEMKKLWFKTMPYFFISFLVLLLFMKSILMIFLSKEIVEDYNFEIYFILFALFFQNLFLILEYPYGAIINQKLWFDYALKIKLLSFLYFLLFYFVYLFFLDNIYYLIMLNIVPGLIMLIFFKRRTLMILNTEKGMIC